MDKINFDGLIPDRQIVIYKNYDRFGDSYRVMAVLVKIRDDCLCVDISRRVIFSGENCRCDVIPISDIEEVFQ